MGCRSSVPRGSYGEFRPGGTSLATQRRAYSGPVKRIVYQDASRHLSPQGSRTGRYDGEFEFDNPLTLRAMSSSALLTRRNNYDDDDVEFPGSPSFRFYLEEDLEIDSNRDLQLNKSQVSTLEFFLRRDSELDSDKDLQLNEKQVSTPIHEQTSGMLNKPHQLIDTRKSLLLNQEAQLRSNKKNKRWKLKYLTKKSKDSRNTAPAHLQALVTPPRTSLETEAVRIQKVTRGFLLRKNLKVLRNVDATVEEMWRRYAKYEEILESDRRARFRVEDKLMHLLSQLSSVRVAVDYKKEVVEKVMSLQRMVNSVSARSPKSYLDPIVEKSGVMMDSDELTVGNPNPSKIQHNRIAEAGSSKQEALLDSAYSFGVRENDKTKGSIDLDSIEVDSSDIVMEFDMLAAPNPSSVKIEESKVVETVNSMEEFAIDGKESISPVGDTIMEKVNLDPIEVQKGSHAMVNLDELTKQPPNKTLEMNELGKTPTADEGFTGKELDLNNSSMETSDEAYDPIKSFELLEMLKKLKGRMEELGDETPESSQLDSYNNQTEEEEMKGSQEVAESERMKNQIEELYQRDERKSRLINELVDWVQVLGKRVERMQRRAKINKGLVQGGESFG